MKYPRYAAYKESGVEWIGEIPEHWRLLKLKYLVWCLDSKRIPLNAQERSFQEGDIEYWGANGVVGYVDKFLFNEELVLIGEDGAPFNEKFREVAFYVNKPIWPNNHIHVLKVRVGISSNFIKHSLNSCDFTNFIEGSTRDKLTQSNLLQIPIAICDTNEQKKISSFLEAKISIIDNITSKLQKLISLLKEKRQAIITKAVTKGLDPNVPMKDSGIEWIGEIPETWNFTKLKHLASREKYSFVDGPFGSDLKNEEYQTDGVPLIQLNNISNGVHLLNDTKFISEEKAESLFKHSIKPGDIVIAKMADPVARSAIVGDYYKKYVIVADCVKLVLDGRKASNRFVNYAINSTFVRAVAETQSSGTTRLRINLGSIKELPILLPSLNEQLQISDFLGNITHNIDLAIAMQKKMMQLLSEYNVSLISHSVTGKIDLRRSLQDQTITKP